MKSYKSKFGYEILIFLTLLFGGVMLFMILQDKPFYQIMSVGVTFILVYVLFLYLNFSTEYTITETGILKIKCGFLYNKNFEINKIKSIAKISNLISSPAPSLDRIELTYGTYDSIIISPKEKIAFANDLTRVNPKIENKLIS